MVYSLHLKNNVSIVRIVFEFYPMLGGSVALTQFLTQKINSHLKNQLIIAPDFESDCKEFDNKFKIPIIRVRYNKINKFLVPILPLVHLLYMLQVYLIIRKLYKKFNFNIIHAHGIGIACFSSILGRFLNVPTIGAVDGSLEAYSKIAGFYETILIKLFKPDYLIVGDDGPKTTEKFKRILKDRAIILSIGIDTDIFKPRKKNKELIDTLGLNESDFIIMSTSSLISVKRIDLAIESFISLLNLTSKNNIYLLIAGDGALKGPLIELAKKCPLTNNIKFLGGIPADIIPDYLSIADVVIGTSLYSNMNVSIQEAMACGIPVVAFDSGGTNKVINHLNNGLLAKPGDVDEFAEKLKLLYDNPALTTELGENARKTIVEERSWDIRLKKELEIYEKVLSKSNK